ncbi:MAG: hypothetical protein HC788_14795 [Sphingopyxis sp.]|nr:hypothetical protein [Sphingopyxis sp.]
MHRKTAAHRAIRARNEPGFAWKSLYLVFGLQAVLAWLVAAPLAAAVAGQQPMGLLDFAGAALEYEHTAYDYATHPKASAAGYAAIFAHRDIRLLCVTGGPAVGRAARD